MLKAAKENSFDQQAEYLFRKAHPNIAKDFTIEVEKVYTSQNIMLIKQQSTQSRKSYELSLIYNKNGECALWKTTEAIDTFGQLAITPDMVPFTYIHMLIRPLKKSNLIDNSIDIITRKVDKNELDCRAFLSKDDISFILKLIEIEPSFIVIQSEGGSGASIPKHIHAHCFHKNKFYFPFLDPKFMLPWNGNPNVRLLSGLTFGIAISGNRNRIALGMEHLRNEYVLPANRVFYWDQDLKKLTGVFIPRTAEVPPSIGFLKDSRVWKFGCFEVLGLFDVKGPDLYQELTASKLERALNETTLQSDIEKKHLLGSLSRGGVF